MRFLIALLLALPAGAQLGVSRPQPALQPAPPPKPPPPAAAVDAEHSAVLSALFTAGQAATKAWPGYDLGAMPFLLSRKGGPAVLIGHPKTQAGYSAAVFQGRSVQVSDSPKDLGFSYRLSYDVDGVAVNAVQYDPGDAVAETVGLAIHEVFHGHQKKTWTALPHADYRAESGEDIALAQAEQEALAAALAKPGNGEPVRDFTALRRRREARPGVRDAELEQERSEGLARFVEYKALDGVTPGVFKAKLLKDLSLAPALKMMAKWRLYATGAAIAELLERGSGDWRKDVAQGKSPFEVLSARTPMDDAEVLRRVAKLQATAGYKASLQAAEVDVKAFQKTRKDALDRFLAQPGLRVRTQFSLAASSPKFYFSTQDGWFTFDDGLLFDPAKVFVADHSSWNLRLEDRPARLVSGQPGFTVEFVVSSSATIKADGKAWAVSQGQTAFSTLEIDEKGASLKVRGGTLKPAGGVLVVENP